MDCYAGDFEAVLGPFSVQAEPAKKRLEAARKIAEECKEMACSKHDTASKQAIWCLLQKSVARALQYDVRVLEKRQAMPLAEELDAILLDAAPWCSGFF